METERDGWKLNLTSGLVEAAAREHHLVDKLYTDGRSRMCVFL